MNEIKTNKFYRFYLIGLFLVLILPLIAVPHWFHPAAWGKSILFRIIFSILIFLLIWEVLFKKQSKILFTNVKEILNRKNRVFLPFLLLVTLFGIFSLATIFSLDSYFSFWGSPYRGDGFLTFGFLIIFAILLFLILKEKDWKKIWDFTLIIGALVALFAVFQKFGLFSKYIVSYDWRPVSTIGGPMFLALYLILLTFLALVFGIVVKGKKRLFYFFSSLLFIFAIVLSATRSAFLGLFVGFLFFIFFYPVKSDEVGISPKAKLFNLVNPLANKILWLKILTGIILILGVLGIFWLRGQPQLVQALRENDLFGPFFHRMWSYAEGSPFTKILESRGSGWKVALEAIKNRPILGYGPENFSIAFDKYYDPLLPGITKLPGGGSTSWWDRGHSFVFDISVSAGIPALIIYLSLFAALFWQLQKLKYNPHKSDEISINQRPAIIAHGIQATFIGYLVVNFFGFDVFSTYLILFLLISYSLYLISSGAAEETLKSAENQRSNQRKISGHSEPKSWKYILAVGLSFFLVWFVWAGNLKPLWANKEINQAAFLADRNQCNEAIEKFERIMSQHTFIDNYARLKYIDGITACIKTHPKSAASLSFRGGEILEESIKLRPYYTRSWLYRAIYVNRLIESNPNLEPEVKEELINRAFYCLERAKQLSPKRQDIVITHLKTNLIAGKYQEAEEKAEECVALNPNKADCWWAKALAHIALKEYEEATESIEIAAQKGLRINQKTALSKFADVYGKLAKETEDPKYYEALVDIYQDLIELEPKNFQYHASLAYVYKELGEYDKAREEAMIVLELSPESRPNVEAFLDSLPK